uniref:Protein kinase domain-containing protein n=1 Tax=Daucus carota subsp. sativus TaxID=79200 RepID=A0A175YPL5_DAUCS
MFHSSGVHSNAKNSRVDSRVSRKIAGTFTEEFNRMRMNNISIYPDAQGLFANANLRMFSLAELVSATRGFIPDMILGDNHYGRAFIGWLDEDTLAPSRIGIGMAVGIKRTNSYARLRTLQAEVDLCGRFNHPYVLRPLGFCLEQQEFLVVYEYTLKGNVTRYAYKDEGKSLSWVIWLKILIGAARYLDFLHSSDDHIIYGDFTLSSILLDWNFNPRIGYSASARFGPKDGGTLITGLPNLNAQHCAASEGYFSPEYKKADATPIKGAIYTGYSGRCSTAVEVVYVHSNAKNSRSDGRVSQKKAGIFTEENSRMRMNKMGILPDAQGLFANANLRMFSLAELLSATRGFNPDMILGENYHGRTFVSWLDEDTLAPSRIGIGMLVAIKRTNSYARLRILQAEVDLCGRFYHPYVLKPLGFCLEKQEFLVVYEYTLKGNVARYAYKDGGKSLSWVIWLRILIGAAKYLDFLHSSEEHIIFGDFTLSSILLDWNFNPKIGYSASARFGPKDGGTLITGLPNLNAQHCAASEGYFSPEYKKAGHLSSKNDVYAFGVVLLEILTGRRVIDVNSKSKKRNLVNKARPVLACERKVKGVVNPKLLERETCPKVVNSILSDVPALALKCLDLDPKKRPSMRQVLEILERVNAIIQ